MLTAIEREADERAEVAPVPVPSPQRAPRAPRAPRGRDRLRQVVRWGGWLFVALVALDEGITALGLARGLDESGAVNLALAHMTGLPIGVVLLVLAVPKLALAVGVTRAWQWLLRHSGTRLDRALVVASLGLCCAFYASIVAGNGLLILRHALALH